MVIKSFKIAIYRISSFSLFPKSFALPPPRRAHRSNSHGKQNVLDRCPLSSTTNARNVFAQKIFRIKNNAFQSFAGSNFLSNSRRYNFANLDPPRNVLRTVFPFFFFLKLSRKGSGARTTGCFTEKLPRQRTDACGKPTRPISSFPEQQRKAMVFFFYGRPLRIFLTFFFLVTF